MSNPAITEREKEILLHSLGVDSRHKKAWRNHFAAATGTDDFQTCSNLRDRGLMIDGAKLSYGQYFLVTSGGAFIMGQELPKD